MSLDIKKDATIDSYALDDEARQLPSTIARYHDAVNEQMRLVDNLKTRLEKEEAVARIDARKMFSSEGTKATQSMIDDEVTCLPAIHQLRKSIAEEERDLVYLKGCLSILETKRKSLDNLVQLWVRDYYNSTQVDKSVTDGKYAEADIKRKMSVDYESINDNETSYLNNRRK